MPYCHTKSSLVILYNALFKKWQNQKARGTKLGNMEMPYVWHYFSPLQRSPADF